MSQIDDWLKKNLEHYEWFETTWSLSEHEEGSEEYAFVMIYKSLKDLYNFYEKQDEVKEKLASCPLDESTYEFRKWGRSHESFYGAYFRAFNEDYQNHGDQTDGDFKHLAVPVSCYRCIEIYAHKDDFLVAFEFSKRMQSYLKSDLYVPPLKFYEKVDIDPALWEDEDFLREFSLNKKNSSIWDEEEEDDEDDDYELEFSPDYSIKDSIQEILSFHETMIEPAQIEEWVMKSENIFESIYDEHDHNCGCSFCSPFLDLYYPIYQLFNLIFNKNKFRQFEEEWSEVQVSAEKSAEFFKNHSSFLWSTYTPLGLERVRPGLYSYNHGTPYYHTLRFVYETHEMEDIFDRIDDYREILRGMENYMREAYNRENKTYYRHYYQYQMGKYFGDRYAEVAAGYFVPSKLQVNLSS